VLTSLDKIGHKLARHMACSHWPWWCWSRARLSCGDWPRWSARLARINGGPVSRETTPCAKRLQNSFGVYSFPSEGLSQPPLDPVRRGRSRAATSAACWGFRTRFSGTQR